MYFQLVGRSVSCYVNLNCIRTNKYTVFEHFLAYHVTVNCLQVVKPLLHERTKLKVQVLQGCGRDELLKVNAVFQLIQKMIWFSLFIGFDC